jgi:predicted RNase H-like HicB family nuclease
MDLNEGNQMNSMGKYTIIVEKGEDGYFIGEALELPGCHTQGKTVAQLMERMKEAISLYLEAHAPVRAATSFVGVQHLEV